MAYSHPVAVVASCTRSETTIHSRLILERTEGLPIAPASLWIGDPPMEEDALSIFQLHRLVKRNDKIYEFETYEDYQSQRQLPVEGSTYYFVAWWSRAQLVVAQSNLKAFKRYLFVPRS